MKPRFKWGPKKLNLVDGIIKVFEKIKTLVWPSLGFRWSSFKTKPVLKLMKEGKGGERKGKEGKGRERKGKEGKGRERRGIRGIRGRGARAFSLFEPNFSLRWHIAK